MLNRPSDWQSRPSAHTMATDSLTYSLNYLHHGQEIASFRQFLAGQSRDERGAENGAQRQAVYIEKANYLLATETGTKYTPLLAAFNRPLPGMVIVWPIRGEEKCSFDW